MLWLNYVFGMSNFLKRLWLTMYLHVPIPCSFFASWWIRPILLIKSNKIPNMIDMHTRWSITIFIWQHSLRWPFHYSQYSDAISLSMFLNYLPFTWPILIERCGLYRFVNQSFAHYVETIETSNGACDCWSLRLSYYETLKLFYWSKFERKKCTYYICTSRCQSIFCTWRGYGLFFANHIIVRQVYYKIRNEG